MPLSHRALAAQLVVPLFEDGHPFRSAVKSVDKTAMRKLAEVAMAAEVPEEVEIVIRYQVGRVLDSKAADQLLKHLREFRNQETGDSMPLIRSFLGQVVRLHYSIQER